MQTPKLSTFIISMLVIGLFVTVIMLFMSKLNADYNYNFDTSTDAYDKFDEINNLTQSIQDKSQNIQNNNVFDVLGNYFSQAYDAVKLSANSFSIFNTMADQTFENTGLPAIFKTVLVAIVMVIIIIGIWLSAIIKREM